MSPVRFIDLFCGIGGFHLAIRNVFKDSECVMACDIDENARATYFDNYGIVPKGDITKLDMEKDLPSDFDLLCGGFPCQSFSIAQWKEAKGFEDPRGTLFFEILRVIDVRRPKCVLLENVANLLRLNDGDNLRIIISSLETRGYNVSFKILSPHQFGIPHNRERIYIVATLDKVFSFESLHLQDASACKLDDIFSTDVDESHYIDPSLYVLLGHDQIKRQKRSGLQFCGYIKGNLRKKGARENTEHLSRAHKQVMRIYSTHGTHPTIASSETSGRYHIFEEKSKRVRKITVEECYRLMAFPSNFKMSKNKGVALRQIGNSVCVKVVEEILKELIAQGFIVL